MSYYSWAHISAHEPVSDPSFQNTTTPTKQKKQTNTWLKAHTDYNFFSRLFTPLTPAVANALYHMRGGRQTNISTRQFCEPFRNHFPPMVQSSKRKSISQCLARLSGSLKGGVQNRKSLSNAKREGIDRGGVCWRLSLMHCNRRLFPEGYLILWLVRLLIRLLIRLLVGGSRLLIRLLLG